MPLHPRILLADDDSRVRSLWADILRHAYPDSHILEATDGHHAYRLYQHHGADILIIAHQLPTMNGIECIKRLRAKGVQTPMVLVSNDEPSHRDITFDTLTVFLFKPANMHQLLTTVTQLLALLA